jgi:hypothetical protein
MNEISFAHILFATGVPGKLFDILRAVSGSIRLTAMSLPNGPRRACPVLTGWAEELHI